MRKIRRLLFFVIPLIFFDIALGLEDYRGIKFGKSISRQDLKGLGLDPNFAAGGGDNSGMSSITFADQFGIDVQGTKRTILFLSQKNKFVAAMVMMGKFNQQAYNMLIDSLNKKYEVMIKPSDQETKKFDAGLSNKLSVKFSKNKDVLLILTRQGRNVEMSVLYMADSYAAEIEAKSRTELKNDL